MSKIDTFNSDLGFIDTSILSLSESYTLFIDTYLWKIIGSISIVLIGVILGFLFYKFVLYFFKRFKLIELINKFETKIGEGVKGKKVSKEEKKKEIFTQKFKIDSIIAKSAGYYVFLLFFRMAISAYGIDDIENFMDDLLRYLPQLFIGVLIGYFGFRFAKFVHDVVLYAFGTHSSDTTKILAVGARGIILFFTIMAILDQVGIATEITTTVLNGFIAMLALAGGLAFGLGGKDVAKDILESFKK